jgi:pimeloyl-ACP methyl ester carboxylesterase
MQRNQQYTEQLADSGIFYRIYGEHNQGSPIAMIMGYGGCMFAWPLRFIERLAQHSKVIIFDNRGTGRSEPLRDGVDLRISHFAEDLADLLALLKFERAHVFGYSLGGCVALEFAHLFPDRVESLILQSTTGGGALYTSSDQEVKDRLANPRGSNFDEMLFDFFDLCMSADSLEQNRQLLTDICTNARPYPTPPRVLLPQLMAIRHFDASGFASDINKKTLLFHGRDDRILKVENGHALAKVLPNSEHVFFDNCGHCPHIEHETAVAERIESFIGST